MKFYAEAPLTYTLIHEITQEKLKIDKTLMEKAINFRATSGVIFTEVTPTVKNLLNDAKENLLKFSERQVKPYFEKYDQNGSGYINKKELSSCLSDLGYKNEEHNNIFQSFDLNNDEHIDYNDFCTCFLNGRKKLGIMQSKVEEKPNEESFKSAQTEMIT